MKKYNLDNKDKDPDDLNDKDINKHKDFKKLMANYDKVTNPLYKTPLYKNHKMWLGVFLFLIILYLLLTEL